MVYLGLKDTFIQWKVKKGVSSVFNIKEFNTKKEIQDWALILRSEQLVENLFL